MAVEVHFRPPKNGHFHVTAFHQHSVPEKLEKEDENERGEEREKQALGIHNFFY
ncbi:MAG: hypothetical protein QOG67_3263 [Verrucomicrobiota bacterium]